MDIYSILASKPHNPHYLKRYIKFITWCQQNPTTEEYTEAHHICPKADDLFPEYTSFAANPWNCVELSVKQHVIAHIILWKVYGRSQATALEFMFNTRASVYTSRQIRWYVNMKSESNANLSRHWTNRARFMTRDGVYHGAYLKDDPIIKELDLIFYRTDAHNRQNLSRTPLATAAKLGTNIYNNGTEEKFFITPPDASWSLGRLPRSDDWESKRRDATVAACKGKKTYNNGLVNRFFADGEPIPEGFVRGMKPRK